jgi:hypothetical protein
MAMEKTSSRVAMALMCGLAICCAVMYVTADGAESIHEDPGQSVSSTDVEKTGLIITNTPDGRMRLRTYLSNVEAEIREEQAAREKDVAAVEAQMARNFAFNKAARAKLEAMLLAKMAVNAKKAKDDLATSMRFVQAKFAAAAKLQNERKNANIARNKKLRVKIAQNKKIAADNLAKSVKTQQRAMAALTSATNARIAQTDKNVAINAAQIKANAKKAREELDQQVGIFDKKAAEARTEAAAGRSKLGQQLATQDKNIREWANNKLKVVAAKTAAQFKRVRDKMQEDRQNADIALKAAATRMTAAMDAFTALNDNRYAKNVADIKAAKEEANARLAKAETSFKAHLYTLTATVNEQVKKTNTRISQLSNTVDKNKVAQAKVNANVAAEQKRMVKLGNERYAEHLAKDKELKGIIDSNKDNTDKRLQQMAAHYTMELNSVRAEMNKNRAHATHMLSKKTSELYSEIAKGERAQMAVNGELQEQTRRASLAIEASLTEAKDDFSTRLGSLHTTVVANDKKFEGKILKLTGIVKADAIKNAEGRKELSGIMEANKAELKAAVRDAIHKGEVRMQSAEDHLVKQNEKTKAALNLKITTEIATMAKRANDQIEGLRLQSKESRDMMKKELLYAVRAMAKEAKTNLDSAVKVATAKFASVNEVEAKAAKKSAKEREEIGANIAIAKENAEAELNSAVQTMQRSLVALKLETEEKIKKTNKRVDAYAEALKKESKDVSGMMKAQMEELTGEIKKQKTTALENVAGALSVSEASWNEVSDKITGDIKTFTEGSDKRFGDLYIAMADQRGTLDKKLATAVNDINDSIAKQSALQDERFSTSVKDISAAKAEAAAEVKQARKDFATELATVTSSIKEMDSRLTGEVQIIAGEVISHKAAQHRVNVHVSGEIKRIETLANDHSTKNKAARGAIREIMDKNKEVSFKEVEQLDSLFKGKIAKIRSTAAADALASKKDLTEATQNMYAKMAEEQRLQLARNEDSATKITTFSTESLGDIAEAKKDFTNTLNTLANVIAANHAKVEREYEVLTGVTRDFKEASTADRELIREQNAAMAADMNKAIVVAIQEGEAKAKAVADRSRDNLADAEKSMLVQITTTVEEYADATYNAIQGNHAKIADNYLSLKAYAVCAQDKVDATVASGNGLVLSSIGDILQTVGNLADVSVEPAEGLSPEGFAPPIFVGNAVKVDNSVSKVNGLVKEYFLVVADARERWTMGLGKYFLMKLEAAMMDKGVLQVDKIHDKTGNFVFVNGHAMGLSNKVDDLEKLAVRMSAYEAALASLTAGLTAKGNQLPNPAPIFVPAPEWQGN